MEQVRVGMVLKINQDDYKVESIYKREHTRHIHEDSRTMRKQAKAICHSLIDFETDEFESGDIVTEWLEEVRFQRLSDKSPLIVHKHKFRKEQPIGTSTVGEVEDGGVGPESEQGIRAESPSEDSQALYSDGQGQG